MTMCWATDKFAPLMFAGTNFNWAMQFLLASYAVAAPPMGMLSESHQKLIVTEHVAPTGTMYV